MASDQAKPYYTSTDLIEAVKRKIALPISQITFTEQDILKFANEEMMISTVPSILEYHQEYFVHRKDVPLEINQNRYSIPDRAIGSRLRDLAWSDEEDNVFEMTRINADDKAYFQRNVGANQAVHKFYLENNDVVLTPSTIGNPTGNLSFYIFLRPNQLVTIDRAATLELSVPKVSQIPQNFLADSSFVQINPTNTITIANHGLVNDNKVIFQSTDNLPDGLVLGQLYYIISATTNTFQVSLSIGGAAVIITSVGTGTHTVVRQLTLEQGFESSQVNFVTDIFTIPNHDYSDNDMVVFSTDAVLPTPLLPYTIYYIVNATSNTFQISSILGGQPLDITLVGTSRQYITSDLTTMTFDQVPTNITSGNLIDFLQTNEGHKTYSYDVKIPMNGVSGNDIIFLTSDVPDNFGIGDYVCSANECIIPQIPSDLHSGLAERTCSRILSAQGDQAGLALSQANIQQINQNQGMLLDQRVDGSPLKVVGRHSLLRYFKSGNRRI